MSQSCFIGVDQGSSATKALVLTNEGQILYQTRRNLTDAMREGARIEQDPQEILRSIRSVLDDAVDEMQRNGIVVRGIGLSCQRSSCLAWNEPTGDPISPVISWRDRRGMDFVDRLGRHSDMIFARSGLPLTPYYSASKFRWLRNTIEDPEAIYGTLSSFLIQQLTGNKVAVADHTSAARTQLMNIRTLTWDSGLCEVFELPGIRLPRIAPTLHNFGRVATPAGPVPILASIGDQQAALVGLGVVEKGDGGINYGTGGFLMVNTGTDLVPARRLMASIHYSTDREQRYLLEGSVNAVGDALEWARTGLSLFAEPADVDALCWRAATDVTAFCGLNGTGAPHWEREISSSFHGLSSESTNADMLRAIVEGIVFFMKDIADELAASFIEPSSYALSGGLSAVTYLARAQADILGKDIRVSSSTEASALGAAMLAGMQYGAWTAADIKTMSLPGEIVRGTANPGLERRYRRWKELHRMTKALDEL